MRTQFTLATLIVSLALAPVAANACGESLFRMGRNVHHPTWVAPIQGTVLVYARTEHERAVAADLERAGHTVKVVETDLELLTALQSGDFDVVVAPVAAHASLAVLGTDPLPAWIPMADKGAHDIRALRSEFGLAVHSDDDTRKYLKAIHGTLEAGDR